MVDPSGIEGFQPRKVRNMEQLKKELGKPTDLRMFAIAQVCNVFNHIYIYIYIYICSILL
jgi:hypothetical protein